MSDIAEIYDIDDMSDKERFILLMGSIDYYSILPVIRFVKSAFEWRAVLAYCIERFSKLIQLRLAYNYHQELC